MRVGQEEKEDSGPKPKGEDKKKSWWSRKSEDVDKPEIAPELVVQIKIPRQYELPAERHAIAMSIKSEEEVMLHPEVVHVKWSTDVDRLKALYHEAQVYDKLRLDAIGVTPRFYGFYRNFRGLDAFGISVFDKSSQMPDPKDRDRMFGIL